MRRWNLYDVYNLKYMIQPFIIHAFGGFVDLVKNLLGRNFADNFLVNG